MASQSNRRSVNRPLIRLAGAAGAIGLLLAGHPAAQIAVSPALAGGAPSGPFQCWWTAGTRAVQVGERFTVVVTCAIIENGATHAKAGMDQFDPTALMLSPFEVTAGTRHQDLQVPPWRYFQFEYTVRLLSDRLFGQDVNIPSVPLKYQLESSNDEIHGRDQTYLLPPLPMRIISRVPANVTDIRDGRQESFGDLERRRTRVTQEFVAAGILFSFSAVFIALALAGAVTGRRARVPLSVRPLAVGSVLNGCLGAARQLKEDVSTDGWSAGYVSRALTIFRIAGAVAVGHPISQTLAPTEVQPREGQLLVRKGVLRRRSALLSAATTVERLTASRSRAPRLQTIIDAIEQAMEVFSIARYNRGGPIDSTALDEAFATGMDAVRRLRVLQLWPGYRIRPGAKRVAMIRSRA